MSPGYDWWGWCDPDTFMGGYATIIPNGARYRMLKSPWSFTDSAHSVRSALLRAGPPNFPLVPWHATEYDVIIPAAGADRLLYMRGHLNFFKAGEETENKLNLFPNTTSVDVFINNHKPVHQAPGSSTLSSVRRDLMDSCATLFLHRGRRILFFPFPGAVYQLSDLPRCSHRRGVRRRCTQHPSHCQFQWNVYIDTTIPTSSITPRISRLPHPPPPCKKNYARPRIPQRRPNPTH